MANGDVPVFLGDDMRLASDVYDEDEQLHRQYANTIGDDQYDPVRPQPGKNCISRFALFVALVCRQTRCFRRCFGWTVPRAHRVFIEGDVRIDLFERSQVKLLNMVSESSVRPRGS